MKVFNLTATPQPIAPPDEDLQNVRDVIVTNVGGGNGAGGGIATLQYDGQPSGSNALGTDVVLAPGVGDLLPVGGRVVIGGSRPGSKLGSFPVMACCAAGTTVVVQIVKGTKTMP